MEIRKSMGRFLSIFFIVALGVSLFVGIRATKPDMILSGDAYVDENKLMDIKVVSTYGLTEEDMEVLEKLPAIEMVEGAYSVDVLCEAGENMKKTILAAAEEGDSVGGVLETAVVGMPAGIGEPWFDSMESMLSHMMFSVPAVKGIEFGAGFAISDMNGSTANDLFNLENGNIVTETNHNGGINGGITNGMPVVFRTAIKPTPTIFKPQKTVNYISRTETVLHPKGRHDPAIVHRARVVQDAAAAIVICDCLAQRFGTDWLKA